MVDRFAAPGRLAVVMRSSGRHVAPSRRRSATCRRPGGASRHFVIDVLTVEDGRIRAISVVADELVQAGAVRLVG